MRDFRDAKTMARALRDSLKTRTVDITHSEALELIAHAFGLPNWNVLAATIDTASHAADSPQAGATATVPKRSLYCSFCGKDSSEVRKLVAGPAVFICETCISVCTDFVEDPISDEDIARLSQHSPGNAQAMPTEELARYIERSRKGIERSRLTLQGIEQRLVSDEPPPPAAAGDRLSAARLAYLRQKTPDELVALQQTARAQLGRDEDALRLAKAALGAHGSPTR